jgi:hypothetical protein
MNNTAAGASPVDCHVRPPTFRAQLVCWHCGASREVLTQGPPQFAFEVAGWAEDAGMKGFFDMERGRVLVFCNGDHARQQMTKDGRFRLRPKRAA